MERQVWGKARIGQKEKCEERRELCIKWWEEEGREEEEEGE